MNKSEVMIRPNRLLTPITDNLGIYWVDVCIISYFSFVVFVYVVFVTYIELKRDWYEWHDYDLTEELFYLDEMKKSFRIMMFILCYIFSFLMYYFNRCATSYHSLITFGDYYVFKLLDYYYYFWYIFQLCCFMFVSCFFILLIIYVYSVIFLPMWLVFFCLLYIFYLVVEYNIGNITLDFNLKVKLNNLYTTVLLCLYVYVYPNFRKSYSEPVYDFIISYIMPIWSTFLPT